MEFRLRRVVLLPLLWPSLSLICFFILLHAVIVQHMRHGLYENVFFFLLSRFVQLCVYHGCNVWQCIRKYKFKSNVCVSYIYIYIFVYDACRLLSTLFRFCRRAAVCEANRMNECDKIESAGTRKKTKTGRQTDRER